MVKLRLLGVFVLAGIASGAAPVRAQTPGEQVFRVTHDTYACINPRATLALTNPGDFRRNDPGWVAFMVSDGQCVTVTPRSPWHLVSRQGDLGFAAYAGTAAQLGSYYFRLSDLAGSAPPHPVPARPLHPVAEPRAVPPVPPVLTADEQPSVTVLPSLGAMVSDTAGQRAGAVLAVLIVVGCFGMGTRGAGDTARRKR